MFWPLSSAGSDAERGESLVAKAKEWVHEDNIRRIAAKRALDLDTGQTIITVIVGRFSNGIIMAFGSMILNLIGWTVIGR